MIYLDNGATSFRKPLPVYDAVRGAMFTCASPGRGGYPLAMNAGRRVLACRERAGELFACDPEQVAFTGNCTHGLNIAIKSLVKPGTRVVITGFEHNAVTRPLHGLGAKITVAGQKLFDWDDTLTAWEAALKKGADAAVFTHCSNVFGYVLPVEEMAQLCKKYKVPFIIDAAQSAGVLPVSMKQLDADFIAMPGHKGLLGPQGTGLLLCRDSAQPLILGGTGSNSISGEMPDFLPDRLEAGTLNVPGIAGLSEGLGYLLKTGTASVLEKEHAQATLCAQKLQALGLRVFAGEHQSGTVSFLPPTDCEDFAQMLAQKGIGVRAGLHCAPLAHKSAGTLDTGTVRVSYGWDACTWQTQKLCKAVAEIMKL